MSKALPQQKDCVLSERKKVEGGRIVQGMVLVMAVTIVLVYETPSRKTPMLTMLEMPAGRDDKTDTLWPKSMNSHVFFLQPSAKTRMVTLCLTRTTIAHA